MSDEELNPLTERIIACACKVANTLGCGFLEKVYENALAHELRKNGLVVETQKQISVLYDGVVVGDYCADLVKDQGFGFNKYRFAMLMPLIVEPTMPTKPWSVPHTNRFFKCVVPS